MRNNKNINHVEVLINKQFEISGYDLAEINYQKLLDTNDQDWYTRYTMTEDQEKEFAEFANKYIKKNVTKYRVELEYSWFHVMYGLKVVG